MKVLAFGPIPLIGSFIELTGGDDWDDYKITEVSPALAHGYELNGEIASPRAWDITVERADPDEVRRWRETRDAYWEQTMQAHRSFWNKVVGR